MPEEVPHRRCLKIIHGNGSGQGEAMKRSDAACLDGSGYAAGLWTKPEFGCNLFEPICLACNGSGKGPFDHKGRCLVCGGSGIAHVDL